MRADGHERVGGRRPPDDRDDRHRQRAHGQRGERARSRRRHPVDRLDPSRRAQRRRGTRLEPHADLRRHEHDRDRRQHLAGAAEDAELLHRPEAAEPERRERHAGHDGRGQRRPPGVVARPARGLPRREPVAAGVEERGVHVHAGVDADADDDRREGDRDRAEPAREERGEARRPERAQDRAAGAPRRARARGGRSPRTRATRGPATACRSPRDRG